MIKILITQAGTGWSGLTKTEQAKWLSAAGKELLAQGISQWFGVRWDCKEEKNRAEPIRSAHQIFQEF